MNLNRREFLYMLGGGVLAACGVASREPDFTVVIRPDMSFEPSSLVVPIGSTVAWHNRADTVHTVTADPEKAAQTGWQLLPSGASPFDSGDLFAGERWAYTFDLPGTYIYFCSYHQSEEMFGTITVTE